MGLLEAVDDRDRIELPGEKLLAVLGMLLVRPNEVVSADRLADGLWGDSHPASAANSVQGYVSRLRKALGADRIKTHPPGYVLTVVPEQIDAVRFERLLHEGRRAREDGGAERALELLSEGLALWRGEPYADFMYAEWAQAEVARLAELRLVATEELVEAHLELGHHDQLLGELDALVVANPLRERLWAARILALYRAGRQADALRAYQELRQRLVEELGIDPSSRLLALERSVLGQDRALDWRPPPAAISALPVSRSTFVGRDMELREVEKLLQENGMVTVVGPGGVGKTRLAIEVARRLSGDYDDVRILELAPLSDASLVVQKAATACGVREESHRDLLESLVAALRPRRLLLMLDNCEHLLDEAARLADALLRAAPALSILATSRQPLRIEGEHVWRAPTLPVPPAGLLSPDVALAFDAVRLFLDRATDAEAAFALTDDNAGAVGEICRRLDGIPLAIELAAARTAALTAAQIAARLDDRFRLLRTGSRAALPRHQTLAAAVEWSYDLCSPTEQALFRRLSVFAGGFTVEAAEAVCADETLPCDDVLDLLSALVDRSLVVAQRRGDGIRYHMLETIRAYAAERLAESGDDDRAPDSFADRHLGWCLAFAEGIGPHLFGPAEAEALRRLERDIDNLRLALAHASRHGRLESLMRLAVALSRFWNVRGYWAEGRRWLEPAIALWPEGPPALRSKALAATALMCERQGDFEASTPFGEEALALARTAGEHATAAEALDSLSSAAQERGDAARAAALLEECLAQWRASGTVRGVVSSFAGALGEVGWGAVRRGDYEGARELFHEALAVATELGIPRARSYAFLGLASVAAATGQLDDARCFLDEATSISQKLADTRFLGREAYMRGLLASNEGDIDIADAEFKEALRSASGRGEQILLTMALEGLARVAHANHDHDRATTLFGAAARIRGTLPWPVPPGELSVYDAALSSVREAVGPKSFEVAWTRGIEMSPEEAVRIALDRSSTVTVTE